ncbi:MAG: YhdP family protein [Betaproteobacteria bacterium]
MVDGFEFSTQGLQFQTRDGLRWPGGNVSVSYTPPQTGLSAQGDFRADKLDLHALGQIANRLPLGAATHAALLAYQPKGRVERIQAHWQGPTNGILKYTARGLVSGLDIAARAATGPGTVARAGSPGVRGASVDFEATQDGGKARLSVQRGAIEFPGIFEESAIAMDQFSAEAQWQIAGDRLAVQLANVKFANADAQGELQAQWHSADAAKSSAHARFPGVLDLQGSLSRGEANRVYRYLPLVLPSAVRQYVHHAVLQGKAVGAKFRVKGDLADMPFVNPKLGEFRIATQLQNVTLAFIPKTLQDKNGLPWPTLTQLNGELIFDRATMQIKGANAGSPQAPGLSLFKAEAQIPDLTLSPTLTLSADARGSVQDALHVVSSSPLGAMLGHALDRAVGSAAADYRLRLVLPLQNLDKSRVQGSVTLAGNDLHITPDSPVLSRARGVINYTEGGFSLVGAQARMLGGDSRIEGGMRPAVSGKGDSSLLLRAQGNVTAEGLRGAHELGLIARLAQNASGASAYSATFGVRQGVAELSISSNLQGFSTGLPVPLNKATDAALPFRYETVLLSDGRSADPGKLQDQLTLEWGRLASASYVRDVAGADPRVLRGSIAVGLLAGESAPTSGEGVLANINLNSVDLDAWNTVLNRVAGTPDKAQPGAAAGARSASMAVTLGYLPNSIAIRAREMNFGAYQLNHVVAGGSRDGLNWRANLQADELGGYLEYRQAGGTNAGRVYARLAQLKIAPNNVKQVETLLDEQPQTIPAIDIVVDDFELRGKKLGRVEIDAVNRGARFMTRDSGVREWRLNRFNISNPEGSLSASGNWAALADTPGQAQRRRTVMNFKLDVADAGGLLARLGMKDVLRRGKGKLEGQVSWAGSPLTLDYPSMAGQFNVNVQTGQFLKVEPGAANLLGVLSLQSLPRRLLLDFRDVFSSGFAFDFIHGDVQIDNGVASTNNLQMKGVNAAALMEGHADIARETQDLKVVVVPEINAGTASLVATIINPAIGLGSFLAQLFLRKPLIEANTHELHISGTWSDPKVTTVEHKSGQPPAVKP